jgi:hypothetical protein
LSELRRRHLAHPGPRFDCARPQGIRRPRAPLPNAEALAHWLPARRALRPVRYPRSGEYRPVSLTWPRWGR